MGRLFDVLVGIAVIAGTVFGAATLYYTAAVYYDWKPVVGGEGLAACPHPIGCSAHWRLWALSS
jgi:hypothetical protein